jgi:aspartate aminotransferase-like enzyme
MATIQHRELFTPDRLFCPGPTPVPKAVLEAGGATSIYHRSDEFYKVFRRAAELLKPLFGTSGLPLILTASGSGAMDAAMTNLTAEGDEVVVVRGGKFGERWEKLANAYKCKTEVVAVESGKAPTADAIMTAVRRQKATKAIFFQANETSTGAYFGVEALTRALRREFKGLIVVDCISSLGAHAMQMDAWEIDAVVAGSQKGFGMPPGLAFVALSDRAWRSLSSRPRFYFDLAREKKGQEEGRSAFTPAASLVFMLREALEELHKADVDKVLAHHALLAGACRAAVKAMELELFAGSAPSNALTAITVPPDVDGQKLVKRLRTRFGMFFAGGQDELKGKIVRFAHLGFVSRFDLIDGVAALEFALHEEGHPGTLGTGVSAAMQHFAGA